MEFSRQECWSGVPSPSPLDYLSRELIRDTFVGRGDSVCSCNREKEKRFHMNGDILLNKECRERSWGTRKHFLK